MDTNKEALQYVAQMAITSDGKRVKIEETTEGERTFIVQADGDVTEFQPNDGAKHALKVHTLNAVIDYIAHVAERQEAKLIVHIVDENQVRVEGQLDKFGCREVLIEASALHPEFPFGRYLDQESFSIMLQSQFIKSEDRDMLLQFVGNLKEEATKTSVDDGVTQIATVKTGVAQVDNVIVPNPVKLTPYRTFPEAVQPESSFVFRVKGGPTAALFESDGGQWRNEAIANIARYLAQGLDDVLDRVTILA